MEAFDSTFLTLLFVPSAPSSADRGRERIDYLIGDIHGRGGQIVIPAPALSELLIGVGHSRSQILHEFTKTPKFIIAPFDTRAAIELALMTDRVSKHSKKGDSGGTWAKVKFDRQIVAICRVYSVTTIYSEDADIRKIAESEGIAVKTVADLPLPMPGPKGPGLFD
jgi:hypothetical protein